MKTTSSPILDCGRRTGRSALSLVSPATKSAFHDRLSADFGLPAWKASAGIINPVTGKRVVKSWNIDTLLPFAIARYQTIAEALGTSSCYKPQPLVRYFRGDADDEGSVLAYAQTSLNTARI